MQYDFLLVGHGIAGAVLGTELRRRGYRVLVYDEPRPDAASRVAAGLMNPVAGKRFALTWRAPDTLPYALDFYRALSQELSEEFLQEAPILKVFGSLDEQQQLLRRAAESPDPWQGFVAGIDPAPIAQPGLLAPYGGAWLRGGGHLRVEALLAALARQGRAAGWLREEVFDWAALAPGPAGGVTYADVQAAQVVCCQGAAALACPHFAWLPLTPNQGAVLDVAVPGLSGAQVLNRGAYVVPAPVAGQFRVGATYRWPPFATKPGLDDERELTARLASLTALPYQVLGERRGVRPAVRDRRPLLGRHPTLPWLSLFGGFGSKGVSLAPRLAALLADALTQGGALWPEANLDRYARLHTENPA